MGLESSARKIRELLPSGEVLLVLEVEELAGFVLEILCEHYPEKGTECLGNFVLRGDLKEHLGKDLDLLRWRFAEAWAWLVGEAMLAESPEGMSTATWYFVTRRGR